MRTRLFRIGGADRSPPARWTLHRIIRCLGTEIRGSRARPDNRPDNGPDNRAPLATHRRRLLLLLLPLISAGCQTQAVIPPGPPLSLQQLQDLVAASDWEGIANAKLDCEQPGDACAEAHANHADACLRLAIQLPKEASAARGRSRRLLDDAEAGYRQALALQRSSDSPRLASYHGGLLLTLSERRNRLDVSEQEQRFARENEKLIKAAELARGAVSDSALGFIYGASALVYRASRSEPGRERCNDLVEAAAMLEQTPSPPDELLGEAQRLQRLVARELKANQCAVMRKS